MRYRCPYCHGVFAAGETSACPHCGRTFLKPAFFAHAPVAADEEASATGPSGVRPKPKQAGPMNRSVLMAALLALLLASGVLLLSRARRPPHQPETSKRALARDNLEVLRLALDQWRAHCGRYPATREGLVALVHDPGAPGWKGPYILELKPDPWKRPFVYLSDTTALTLFSSGADGLPATPDDIHSATPGGSPERDSPAEPPATVLSGAASAP